MSLPRYPNYKPSGAAWLGEVPGHWDLIRLRRCVQLNPSKGEIADHDRAAEVSFLPMDAVGNDGQLDLSRTRPVGELETGYTYFRDGDVALAKITPCFENGKGALMTGLVGGFGFGTTELIVARPIPSRIHPAFLNWLFRSPNFRLEGEARMYGAGGQKRVPDDFVRELVWSIPALAEQTTIASFLDHETAKIDALIAEQEKLIALLAEKRQATISHAVTRGLNPEVPMKDSGVAWLGEVPGHWEVCALRRVIRAIEQGWSPECHAREADENEWGVLKAGCLNGGVFRQTENKALPPELTPDLKYEVQVGDVLMSRASGSPELVGSTAVVTATRPGLMLSDKIFRLRLEDAMLPRFFAIVLNSRASRTQIENALSGGNGMANNLPQSNLLEFSIAVPPTAEQVAIADFVEAETNRLDSLRAASERAITLLKERRAALIAAAVTGQIDVRGWIQPVREAEAA